MHREVRKLLKTATGDSRFVVVVSDLARQLKAKRAKSTWKGKLRLEYLVSDE
jgi:hypothetical protein